MVNSRTLIIAAYILMLPGTSLQIGQYMLDYSLFGFGLLALAGLFTKPAGRLDIVVPVLSLLVFLAGLLNWFFLFYQLSLAVLFLAAVRIFLYADRPVIERSAFLTLFLAGTLSVMILINFLGFLFLVWLIPLLYFFLKASVAVLTYFTLYKPLFFSPGGRHD